MANTQTVTVLFTDVVGSTELSSRLGPDVSDQLRQAHFSLLRQALAANDGTEVKNLGDGLMTVFTSPSAAVAGAVAMQQGVEKDNRRSDNPLGLRVGVSVGEVTTEDDDYFGDPVVEAARLCAICEGGQILATDTVRSMAGRRSPHPFAPLGERELKGLPDPLAVYEVGWEPAASASGVPLPDRLESPTTSLFGFFGREREKERLIEAVKNTAEGTRRVAFLSGEPGIGKTSLCRQLANEANDLGVCVLYGRCDEDLGVSYQPFAEALSHLVVHGDESLLKDHVANNGGALLGLVPVLAKRIPEVRETHSTDPDSERLRLFSAVVSLLGSASAKSGMLLVIDDLHWADKASLQLLRHVVCSGQLSKVMVLGAYRDSELSAGNALSDTLASLRRQAEVERIDLLGLEDFEIIGMMEQVAGHRMDQDGVDLAHAVRRETDGNAFFTTELLTHLGESGLVHQDETGHWVASEDLYEKGLPQSVREVVGQRVDRLGEETRRVLSQAAVIGRDFDIVVLAAVTETDEDSVLDLVDEAVRAGLLTEVEGAVERFSFAHALMQHTLYEDLGPTRRARAHRKIAEVLEDVCGDSPEPRAAELARHFTAATKTADSTKALLYSKMAGDQALAQLAPADALGWYSQALDLYAQIPPDQTLHCDLLIGLGTAQRRTGDPAHRQTLFDAAGAAQGFGDGARLVSAALANSRGAVSATGEVDEERVAVLEQALVATGQHDSPERALLLATLGAELIYGKDDERSSTYISEALALARSLDDPITFLRVTGIVYHDHDLPDNLNDRLSDLTRAVAIADSLDDPQASFSANINRAVACLQIADSSGLRAHLERAEQTAERLDEPYHRWRVETVRSMLSLLRGEVAAAQAQAETAFAIGGDSVPEAIAGYGSQLVDGLRVQGRWPELGEVAEFFSAAAADNPGLPVLRAALARTYCDLGRDDEAMAVIDSDLDDRFAQFAYDVTWMVSMTVLSEICVHFDQVEEARLLYDWLRPWHDQVATAGALTTQGPVAIHLGALAATFAAYEDSETHFAEALEIAKKLGSPYWIARTQVALAKMLLRRIGPGDGDRAKTLLTSAHERASRYGFGGIREQVEALL